MHYPPLPDQHPLRVEQVDKLTGSIFDVVVIGGGINGTCLYHYLKQKGYKTAIVDAKDFASGTTQHSGMMIWGGLLYLQHFDFKAVYQFSKARDQLLKKFPQIITPRKFHFIRSKNSPRNKIFDCVGLHLYWLLSFFERQRPQIITLKDNQQMFSFEEAQLLQSDAQFALTWLNLLPQNDNLCMNYFEIKKGKYYPKEKLWFLEGLDHLYGKEYTLKTKWVINACGVWTDQLNIQFDITTPYRHVLSKGVYLNLQSELGNDQAYIYEMGQHLDVLTYVPWGPVALWGPTETIATSIEEGFHVQEKDITFLLERGKDLPNRLVLEEKIISTRCGIRPLAVPKNEKQSDGHSLKISRLHHVILDPVMPWASIYGGKLSGCTMVAQQVVKMIAKKLKPSSEQNLNKFQPTISSAIKRPSGFNFAIPDIKWCMENQFCFTLEDYLRRRTNIAQWIENNGLGSNNQFEDLIKEMCLTLCLDNLTVSEQHFEFYATFLKNRI